MNYFNERFRQIKNSDLPTISTPNGNVGMKCLPQPFNNFLDPAGGFTFYPNFNYSRIFENDMRNCRNANYLSPGMHGTGNIKQTGPPFCYHSGMPSTLYQNCYHNGDPKAPHPNFFYAPNFYPHPQPSRVTPPNEFAEGSKLNLQSEPNRSLPNNLETNASSRSSSSANNATQGSSRNCSYIPHRPFQNPEALFWNSLTPAGLPRYPDKPPSILENQSTLKNDSASAGNNKTHAQISGSQSEGGSYGRGSTESSGRHGKSGTGHHKKSNCASATGQAGKRASSSDKNLKTNGDSTSKSDVRTAEADSQSAAERDKMEEVGLANGKSCAATSEDLSKQKSSAIPSLPSPPLTSSAISMPPPLPQQGISTNKQQQQKFGLIKCPLCGEHLQSNEQLDLHLRLHVDNMPPPDLTLEAGKVKGQADGKKKVAKKEVKLQGKGEDGTESKTKPLCQCVGCQKTFTRVDKLKLHVSKRHPELLPSFYKCPHCQQGFEKCLALKQHLKTTHLGLTPKAKIKPQYTCEECGELLSSRRDLVYHSMGHSGESPLHCPECGGKFTRPDKLKRHMFIHTGELPFTCSRCGQGFSRTDRLKEHTRLAHNESLLKCPSCDRVFDTWLQVKHHLKSHEYTCEECGESFTRKRKLQFHVMAHRTDKLLRCSECGIRFGHPSRLKKHIEFVHNSKVPLGRASISDAQNNLEDTSKIKVEPGCEPAEIEEDQEGAKVESWSYRLRRVEDLKKPQVAYADKTQDLEAEEFYDDDFEEDGDDGSYEYDCRRGFNRKRKKKKRRSAFGKKFPKYHMNGLKVESKEGILSKAGFAQASSVDAGIYPAVDIKKDAEDSGENQITGTSGADDLLNIGNKVMETDKQVCDHDNNDDDEEDDDDDDTDVEGEVSTVYCSVCYLGFSSSEELVQHSGQHLLPGQSHAPSYDQAPYRLPGNSNGHSDHRPVNYETNHLGFPQHPLNQCDFTATNQNRQKDMQGPFEQCDNNNVDPVKMPGQNHIHSDQTSINTYQR